MDSLSRAIRTTFRRSISPHRYQKVDTELSIPLNAQSGIDENEDDTQSTRRTSSSTAETLFSSPLIIFLCGVTVACTIANLIITTPHVINRLWKPTPPPLKVVTPYFGLERAGKQPPYSLDNYSRIVAQVNSSNPSYVFPYNGPHAYDDIHGSTYNIDRHFVVSSEVSTIIQYRILDYGLEYHRLKFSLPTHAKAATSNKTFSLDHSGPNRIVVWELDVNTPLDTMKLSWKTKPRRKQLLWSFDAEEDSELESTEFESVLWSFGRMRRTRRWLLSSLSHLNQLAGCCN
ncbi:hypothetical protein ABKN59_002439 [Abortiporus biennis]